MRKRGIVFVVLLCILASVGSSIATIYTMDRLDLVNGKDESSKEIVINNGGKSHNIYHAVSDKAMPSVVGITTISISENIFAIPTQSQGVGTGVIVDEDGYILTNSHVVDDGKAVEVNVLFNDGTTTKGKVLWNDYQLDLAMVKVEKQGLTPAELGNSDEVRVGDISIAIGNPLGLEFQKSVTQGIISGMDRTIETEKATMTGLMQTDASINPGNSGGPLLNEKGQVIGINTAKVSQAEGLGFAIPINTAKPIIEQIISKGKFEKVTLGIKGIDLQIFESATGTNLEAEEGVYIAEVLANTPANRAGIKASDVIVKVGEDKITTMSDLNKALYKYSKGQEVEIEINRGGVNVKVKAKF